MRRSIDLAFLDWGIPTTCEFSHHPERSFPIEPARLGLPRWQGTVSFCFGNRTKKGPPLGHPVFVLVSFMSLCRHGPLFARKKWVARLLELVPPSLKGPPVESSQVCSAVLLGPQRCWVEAVTSGEDPEIADTVTKKDHHCEALIALIALARTCPIVPVAHFVSSR